METPPEGGAPEAPAPTRSSVAHSTAPDDTVIHTPNGFERLSDLIFDDTLNLEWLVEPILTTDALGIIAAPPKSLKTWGLLDLAVGIATGTHWLGSFRVRRPGPVLLVMPEGGRAGLRRRVQAILSSLGDGLPSDLDLAFVTFRGVALRDPRDLATLRAAARDVQPVAICADSLYLALRGTDPTRLVESGETLNLLGELAGEAGAAVVVTHHLNRNRDVTGAARISGAGPAEWASTLLVGTPSPASLSVAGVTVRAVSFELVAREVPELAFTGRFEIGATNPSDLSSPLTYKVSVDLDSQGEAPADGLSFLHCRVLDALRLGGTLDVRLLGDVLAHDGRGHPLRRETIGSALDELVSAGLVDGAEGLWWAASTGSSAGGSA